MNNERQQNLGTELWAKWAAMWNGNLSLAAEIIGDTFVAHLTADAPPAPFPISDRRSVARWVGFIRERRSRIEYGTEVGPIVDGDLLAGYWRASGMTRGDDGAPPQPFAKVGMDILRVENGRIVACWTMSNNA